MCGLCGPLLLEVSGCGFWRAGAVGSHLGKVVFSSFREIHLGQGCVLQYPCDPLKNYVFFCLPGRCHTDMSQQCPTISFWHSACTCILDSSMAGVRSNTSSRTPSLVLVFSVVPDGTELPRFLSCGCLRPSVLARCRVSLSLLYMRRASHIFTLCSHLCAGLRFKMKSWRHRDGALPRCCAPEEEETLHAG